MFRELRNFFCHIPLPTFPGLETPWSQISARISSAGSKQKRPPEGSLVNVVVIRGNYSGWIASTGHTSAQEPQSVHTSASIV